MLNSWRKKKKPPTKPDTTEEAKTTPEEAKLQHSVFPASTPDEILPSVPMVLNIESESLQKFLKGGISEPRALSPSLLMTQVYIYRDEFQDNGKWREDVDLFDLTKMAPADPAIKANFLKMYRTLERSAAHSTMDLLGIGKTHCAALCIDEKSNAPVITVIGTTDLTKCDMKTIPLPGATAAAVPAAGNVQFFPDQEHVVVPVTWKWHKQLLIADLKKNTAFWFHLQYGYLNAYSVMDDQRILICYTDRGDKCYMVATIDFEKQRASYLYCEDLNPHYSAGRQHPFVTDLVYLGNNLFAEVMPALDTTKYSSYIHRPYNNYAPLAVRELKDNKIEIAFIAHCCSPIYRMENGTAVFFDDDTKRMSIIDPYAKRLLKTADFTPPTEHFSHKAAVLFPHVFFMETRYASESYQSTTHSLQVIPDFKYLAEFGPRVHTVLEEIFHGSQPNVRKLIENYAKVTESEPQYFIQLDHWPTAAIDITRIASCEESSFKKKKTDEDTLDLEANRIGDDTLTKLMKQLIAIPIVHLDRIFSKSDLIAAIENLMKKIDVFVQHFSHEMRLLKSRVEDTLDQSGRLGVLEEQSKSMVTFQFFLSEMAAAVKKGEDPRKALAEANEVMRKRDLNKDYLHGAEFEGYRQLAKLDELLKIADELMKLQPVEAKKAAGKKR